MSLSVLLHVAPKQHETLQADRIAESHMQHLTYKHLRLFSAFIIHISLHVQVLLIKQHPIKKQFAQVLH